MVWIILMLSFSCLKDDFFEEVSSIGGNVELWVDLFELVCGLVLVDSRAQVLDFADFIIVELGALVFEFLQLLDFPQHFVLDFVGLLECLVDLRHSRIVHRSPILGLVVMGTVIQLGLHLSTVEFELMRRVGGFFKEGVGGIGAPFAFGTELSRLYEWLNWSDYHVGLALRSLWDGLQAVSFLSVVAELAFNYG